MYITKQINQNECGVCVLNTLFYHFFKKDIKMELLRDANISDQGLNIYELENLGLKYGMRLESYQIDFAEFKQLKNNNLLIVLVERNGSPHYTLVKKNKNSLIMFDSVNGRVETTYQEIEPTFKNIVIIPTKQTFKIKINEQKVIIKPHYHLKYISFVILIQLLIIIASVIGSNYISEIINKSLSIGSIKNILVVSFGYGIVFVLENIATYISKLVIGRQSRDIAKILSSNYIEKLKYKNYEFLCKCDKKYFYLIENAINIIANYNAFELTQFIASCVSSIILTIILTIINISYLLTIFCAVVLLVGCTLIHYYYSKEIIKKTFSNIAISEETNTKIAQYITYHHNTYALNKITTDLKNNFFEMSTIAKNSNLINASHKSCISIIEKLLLIIIVGLSTYQILNIEQNLTIAKTILSINLIGIL
jgi:ABC-type bacteriocin/lantibiotic exporter with double-glycine peptidase domain